VTGSVTENKGSGTSGREYWLVAKEDGPETPLTVSLPDGREALPIFSFAEEAEMFLWFGWDGCRAFEVSRGELLSMLSGPRVVADAVVLDPSPEILAEMAVGLVTLSRERFVDRVADAESPKEPRAREDELEAVPTRGPMPWLPPGYNLDGSDPDILFLRRWDGSAVAAFSARGATREGIKEAAEMDSGLILSLRFNYTGGEGCGRLSGGA
jgi:hypothetical protein